MVRRAVPTVGGLLVLFHAWLFGSQWWGGQLAEPALILRWLVAAALVVALAVPGRRGAPLFRGRGAVTRWLLVALLHGPAIADRTARAESPALPEAVAVLVEVAAASGVLGFGLLVLAAMTRRSLPGTRLASWLASAWPSDTLDSGRALRFPPRPPPLARSLVRA
ncbi:MAG: hypothetical protein IT179_10460 [Acidobacteria bacterium]|nr:hypothetical protein [Acidobacteriota bacterium]